jgi:hypothetical protein
MTMSSKTTRGKSARFLSITTFALLTTFFLSGCTATAHSTPYYGSDHSYSTSRVYQYYYYPDADIYYDPYRHKYHYNHGTHGWVSVTFLPSYIHYDKHRYHVIRSPHHRPWKHKHAYKKHHRHYDGHKKRRHNEHYNKHYDKRYDNQRHGMQYRHKHGPAKVITKKKVVVIESDHPNRHAGARTTREHAGKRRAYPEYKGGRTYVSREAKRLAQKHRQHEETRYSSTREKRAGMVKKRKQSEYRKKRRHSSDAKRHHRDKDRRRYSQR